MLPALLQLATFAFVVVLSAPDTSASGLYAGRSVRNRPKTSAARLSLSRIVSELSTSQPITPPRLLVSTNMIYFLAYIGGILLNLMPCVLPVLFLKAMSMQRRSWLYVAGVMSVFFTLGIAACGPGFIWGGQFDHWWFTWATAAVCFALGLTYLDVWPWPNACCHGAEGIFGKTAPQNHTWFPTLPSRSE